jgi:hypothetical protein
MNEVMSWMNEVMSWMNEVMREVGARIIVDE